MRYSRRGESLIELLVALVILEVAGAAALAAALTIERTNRHASAAAAIDQQRTTTYRDAELQSSCLNAPASDTVPLLLPEAPQRPAVTTLVRCGP